MAILTRTRCGRWPILMALVLTLASATLAAKTDPPEPPPQPLSQRRENVDARYIGCFKDTSAFDLDGYLERSDSNVPWRCVETCTDKGFAYAAVQYGESCLCGNRFGRYGEATNCDYRCTGDGGEICGGYNANSVYWTGDRKPLPPRPPAPPPPPGGSDCGPADPQIAYNTNRVGGDYKRFDVTSKSCPQQCAKACVSDKRCKSWSFVRTGNPGVRCFLKDSDPAPGADPCCDSGAATKARVREWIEPH